MEDLKEIRADVKEIRKDVTQILVAQARQETVLGVNTDSLKLHMKRTDQNERLIYFLIALACLGGAEKLGILAKLAQAMKLFM